jgi:single-strand DNA-binding protein
MRVLASGKHVTSMSLATNEYVGNGREKAEYHALIAWDRLADICADYLAKGSLVAVEGRLQTRQWDDDAGKRHWKTEVVAAAVEMLSGRRKKDYAAEALAAQAAALGGDGQEVSPAVPAADPEAEELEVAAVG